MSKTKQKYQRSSNEPEFIFDVLLVDKTILAHKTRIKNLNHHANNPKPLDNFICAKDPYTGLDDQAVD